MKTNSPSINFTVGYGKRIILFLCITCLGYLLTSGVAWVILHKAGQNSVALLRILAVVQDIFLFIMPALITALLITRLPANFLCLTKAPRLTPTLVACLILLTSMPALNGLISWNESLSLPDSMSNVEKSMRLAEDAARASVGILLSGDSVASLIVSVLIVGVLAGFSEEIFFRGTLQRLLASGGKMSATMAVILTAFIFSFIHFQFYGFFPRFALGLYLGFLLVLTGSVWVPAIVHALNNSLYIIGNKLVTQNGTPIEKSIGGNSTTDVIISLILTAALFVLLIRIVNRENAK